MGQFTFGGVPYETSPDSGGNYRDLDAIGEASVREVVRSNPRKTIIDSGLQAELFLPIRVRTDEWERFQALREQRNGTHLLVLNGKTCNAQLLELTEQRGGSAESGKIAAYAKFLRLPQDYDPDEVIDWEKGRRW